MAARATRRPHSRRPRPVPIRRVSKGGGGGSKGGGCAVVLFMAGLALMATAGGALLAMRGGA